MVTSAPTPRFDAAAIRTLLVGRARVSSDPAQRQEAEDLAHTAIVKLLQERERDGAPPAPIRALKHLHDVTVDSRRRRHTRQANDLPEEADFDSIPADPDIERQLAELFVALEPILDHEELEYVLLRVFYRSDALIAELIDGWDPSRVSRVRLAAAVCSGPTADA